MNEKMTAEKAIYQLTDLIKDRESFCHRDDFDDMFLQDIEACKAGIKALEKLIPQEPLGGSDYRGNDYMICRNCSAIVEDDDWRATYCPDCGQALDWSDENE